MFISVPECPVGFNYYFKQRSSVRLIKSDNIGLSNVCLMYISVPECPEGFNYYFKQRSSCYYIPTGNNEEDGKSWDDARVCISYEKETHCI